MTSTPTKFTPLHTIALRLGAQFGELQGWRVPQTYAGVETELAVARQGVALADETPNGKLIVEGDLAEDIFLDTWGVRPLAINAGVAFGGGHVYRLRHDRFFVAEMAPSMAPPVGEASVQGQLRDAVRSSGHFITVTDVTSGRAELRVIGPASQALLGKLCGLDFHSSEFPDGCAKQSSLAKTPQLIIRRDLGGLAAFSIIGGRSLGAYLWETIMAAGLEWGIVPIGRAAMNG